MKMVVLLTAGMLAVPAAGCDQRSPAGSGGTASDPPSIQSVSPGAGPVGTTVEVVGANFAPADNVIRFGPGYIRGLPSREGTRITVTVPDGVDLCAPGATPCSGGFQRISPGSYAVSVIVDKSESNQRTFTVVE
jgi:IPT/TIG domain-containing protein